MMAEEGNSQKGNPGAHHSEGRRVKRLCEKEVKELCAPRTADSGRASSPPAPLAPSPTRSLGRRDPPARALGSGRWEACVSL